MNSTITFNIDHKAGTLFIMKIFTVPVEDVWSHFTQAALLDQWWAPQPWQCETMQLDFRPEGIWRYAMVSPAHEKHYGGAKFNEIKHHRSFDYIDFFSDSEGNINTDLPSTKSLIGFTGVAEGTKLTINNHFNSPAEMQQLLDMGVEEGLKSALNQLEDLLNKKRLM